MRWTRCSCCERGSRLHGQAAASHIDRTRPFCLVALYLEQHRYQFKEAQGNAD